MDKLDQIERKWVNAPLQQLIAPGLRWPELLWSGDMRRIGGDIVLNKRFDPVTAKLALFKGRSNDDIGMVAFIGPTFCINPSACLPRTLHVVVDIAPEIQ